MIDPRAFLQLAQKLLANEKNPAGFRSAVSRAYYAAFNVTAEFLKGIDCEVQEDAKGHTQAYYRLNNCGDAGLANIANHLHDLRNVRNVADYNLGSKPQVEQEPIVSNWVTIAGQIIAELEACNTSGERKSAVKTAIKAYVKQSS
jgi:hypothetical protein